MAALLVGGFLILLLVMCSESGYDRVARIANEGRGHVRESDTVRVAREGLLIIAQPLREFAFLGGALLGSAFLGGVGRDESGRWPGRLVGLVLGILVIGLATLGGFANGAPFMQALHSAELAALGLMGMFAVARVVGSDPSDL
jgi:hypothetical protein